MFMSLVYTAGSPFLSREIFKTLFSPTVDGGLSRCISLYNLTSLIIFYNRSLSSAPLISSVRLTFWTEGLDPTMANCVKTFSDERTKGLWLSLTVPFLQSSSFAGDCRLSSLPDTLLGTCRTVFEA